MKRKITLEDWTYIGKYNALRPCLRRCCSYTIERLDNGDYRREQKMYWWTYILMFIPVHLLNLIMCLWDGGIKEFSIEKRPVFYDILWKKSESWKRAEEVFKKNKKVLTNN